MSRAGIIFVSESDLDWEPVLKSWLKNKPNSQSGTFQEVFEKYVGTCEGPKSYGKIFQFINKHCKPVVYCTRIGMIQGCMNLLDGLLSVSDLASNAEQLAAELERLFVYALTWSVGGNLETADRAKFTEYITKISTAGMPTISVAGDSLHEYRVNPDSMEWERWKAPEWEYPRNLEEPDFSNMLVPTIESTRSGFILTQLHKQSKACLMTAPAALQSLPPPPCSSTRSTARRCA